ncbi:MAG: MmcB family DNA repair protein [Xanthobacteraceae bacterium]|nr:MmcB family DNA repair protein [Xanthobacteraceae bacterium]
MSPHLIPTALALPADGRQSETALAVARGSARLLRALGFSCVSEVPLPSGRRADLVALNPRGEIWILEIKSSLEDLRADQKWPEYRAHCDRLFFAFTAALPEEIFPAETGLIVADAYGAELRREAPEHRLPPATRKLMTLRFGLMAAQRLARLADPQGHVPDGDGS